MIVRIQNLSVRIQNLSDFLGIPKEAYMAGVQKGIDVVRIINTHRHIEDVGQYELAHHGDLT